MKKIPRWLPGALVSILLMAVILYFVDLGAMVEAIRKANYGILAVAFLLSIVWMFGRAKVWHTLLRGTRLLPGCAFHHGGGLPAE